MKGNWRKEERKRKRVDGKLKATCPECGKEYKLIRALDRGEN